MQYIIAPTSNYLAHSAKGSEWKKHKYIKKSDGKYYYPNSYEGGRHLPGNKSSDEDDLELKELKQMEDADKETEELEKMENEEKKLVDDIANMSGMKEEVIQELINIARTPGKGVNSKEYKELCKDLSEGDNLQYNKITSMILGRDNDPNEKKYVRLKNKKTIKHGIEFPAYEIRPSNRIIYW